MNDLMNAPARLSDLKGDDLRAALFERHDRAKQDWLDTRQRRGPVARLMASISVVACGGRGRSERR